ERRLRSAGAEVRRYHRTEPMTDTEGTHARPEVVSHGLRRRDDSPVVGDRSVGPRQRLHGTECDLTRGRRDSRRLRRVRRARARAHVTWRSAEPTTAERATHRAPTQPDTRLVDLADADQCDGAPIACSPADHSQTAAQPYRSFLMLRRNWRRLVTTLQLDFG